MRLSIRTLIVVLLTVMSFAAAQAVQAEDIVPIPLSGTVTKVLPDYSTIWIEYESDETFITVEIIGFPFSSLEDQLSEAMGEIITISVDDCVTITYYVKDLKDPDKDDVNKFISLTAYCVECGFGDDCYGEVPGEDPLEPKQRRENNDNEPDEEGNGPDYQYHNMNSNPN